MGFMYENIESASMGKRKNRKAKLKVINLRKWQQSEFILLLLDHNFSNIEPSAFEVLTVICTVCK